MSLHPLNGEPLIVILGTLITDNNPTKRKGMKENDIIKLRVDASIRGKWNIGFFAAGFTFWIFIGAIGNNFPLEKARIYMVAGTFLIFPFAVDFSKLFKADPFTKGNVIGELVGYTHMSVIALSFPIIILTAIYLPDALIFVMAILYCLDFYVMTWSFGTWLFGVHAAFRTIIVTLIYFAVPAYRLTVLPFIIAFLYLITVVLIPILRHKWLKKSHESNA
ncbi:MAG: hypothetical protein EOO93_02090 [Pedobacter sp.]|nr:MAG: hypothetical protein EOO93_02090 [Pedobacter sp.]